MVMGGEWGKVDQREEAELEEDKNVKELTSDKKFREMNISLFD